MILLLLRYGWHGSRALAAVMNESARDDLWREYMATVAYSIGRIEGGEKYPIPPYSDLTSDKPQDERTGEEILDGLIDRLKGGQ